MPLLRSAGRKLPCGNGSKDDVTFAERSPTAAPAAAAAAAGAGAAAGAAAGSVAGVVVVAFLPPPQPARANDSATTISTGMILRMMLLCSGCSRPALSWPDAVNLPRQVGARTLASSFPPRRDTSEPRDLGLPVKKCWFDRKCRATTKAKPRQSVARSLLPANNIGTVWASFSRPASARP